MFVDNKSSGLDPKNAHAFRATRAYYLCPGTAGSLTYAFFNNRLEGRKPHLMGHTIIIIHRRDFKCIHIQ